MIPAATHDSEGDDRTPLLGASSHQNTSRQAADVALHTNENSSQPSVRAEQITGADADETQGKDKELPLAQVLLLCFLALEDPIAYFSIFPFVNEMIERTGDVNPADVGFWSGMVESLFSLVQMLLMLFYGRIADRVGRKPVLVFSTAGISIASALFGLSKTLWQMILFRAVAGLFSGNVVTIRTMIAEISTKKTQARAFSWYMFARNLGILIGPILGGALVNLADQYPGAFGRSQFLRDYPYAIPCFAVGSIGALMTLASLFGLTETLKVKAGQDTSRVDEQLSTWEVLKSPGVFRVLWIYNHFNLVSLCYTAVMPVVMYTPITLGGFSLNPQQISIMLVDAGISQATWTLLAFPTLQHRFGTGPVLRGCTYGFVVFLAAYPILNQLLRHDMSKLFWGLGPTLIAIGSGVAMGFACIQLCLNDISPSPNVNATLNALALAITCGLRAFVPALFTSVFALGVKWQVLGGQLIWICLEVLAIALCTAVRYLPAQAEGMPKQKHEPDREQHAE